MFYDDGLGAAMEIAAIRDRQEALQKEIDRQNAAQVQQRQIPVTLVEHMADPRAAQLQMLFASLDERGKKTLIAMAAAMARLHKDGYHG